ncbi:MAG: hypothetical protein AAF411_10375 [Myxococcota bacterium]
MRRWLLAVLTLGAAACSAVFDADEFVGEPGADLGVEEGGTETGAADEGLDEGSDVSPDTAPRDAEPSDTDPSDTDPPDTAPIDMGPEDEAIPVDERLPPPADCCFIDDDCEDAGAGGGMVFRCATDDGTLSRCLPPPPLDPTACLIDADCPPGRTCDATIDTSCPPSGGRPEPGSCR